MRIDIGLERNLLTTSPTMIAGDNQLGSTVVIAVGNCFAGEATKDDRMNRADPSTGQHGNRQLSCQRHVDRNTITRFDAVALQDVSELANFVMQLLIGQCA